MNKIVISNGSYAKRQETIDAVRQYLTDLGYEVYIFNAVYNCRMQVEACDHDHARRIQRFMDMGNKILKDSKALDESAKEATNAKKITSNKLVEIFNGGICDLEAYAAPQSKKEQKALREKLFEFSSQAGYSAVYQLLCYDGMVYEGFSGPESISDIRKLEEAIYRTWVDFSKQYQLPVTQIAAGSHEDNIQAICTSIENFLKK